MGHLLTFCCAVDLHAQDISSLQSQTAQTRTPDGSGATQNKLNLHWCAD